MATARQRWTQLERRLWTAVRRGDEVEVRSDGTDPTHIWGPTRTVRAEVIRELLLTPHTPLPGRVPSLQLSGARITGALDLEHARIDVPFGFDECWFDEPINLYAARTRTIYLQGCRIPGMYAEELRADGELNLRGLLCTGRLDVDNTHISGPLTLTNAQLSNPEGVALSADSAEFGGEMLCNGVRTRGETRLAGAHIKGNLDLTGASLTNPGGDALWADSAQIGGDVTAFGGFHAVGRTCLSDATIGRSILAPNAIFDNGDGPALQCDGIRVAGSLSVSASTLIGEFVLTGAQIGGSVLLRDTVLSNPGGYAFSGQGLRSAGGMFGTDLQVAGAFTLFGAHITATLSFSGATMANPDGNAFAADGTVVEGNAFFDDFSATGQVRLPGAHIRGQLNLERAAFGNAASIAVFLDGIIVGKDIVAGHCRIDGELHIINARVEGDLVLSAALLVNEGDALTADSLTVGRTLDCSRGFSCTGEMSLSGATIGHQLSLRGATLRHPGKFALRASHLTVGADIFADEDFTAHGTIELSPCRATGTISLATENVDGTVDLTRARADTLWLTGKPGGPILLIDATVRVLEHHPEDWPDPDNLDLQGLTYSSLQPIELPVGQWLKWLRRGLPDGYRPQPYAQLATMLRTVGNDRDSRVVLLARQRHRRRHLPLWSKPWGWLQDLAVGYGYVPWRAAGWLGVLWLAGWLYFRTQQPLPQPSPSTSDYQPALYALDLLLPVLSIGQRSAVHFPAPAQAIAVLITVCSWILGIAVLAGLTRALTRN
ncbi:hypothetical protein [Kutzneria sp. 744]|uniref:hypothetical protein n=1 Tax=Kutzneria sp. (strain 744) TaxID=345341 RepID=UPI0003EEDEF6|nr:hypothetical protein [Kutzneria sp. 744]EWM18441.1 membrane protein [Kutzneria sp. 744]